jgi:hypothetical protein
VKNVRVTAGILEQKPLATITATDGCFALNDLPDAMLELSIDANGLPAKKLLALPGEAPLTITLNAAIAENRYERTPKPLSSLTPQRDGGSIRGSVRVGSKPLAGAPVLLHSISDETASPLRVITDAKGTFQANRLPPRQYMVTIDDDYPRLRPIGASRMYGEAPEPAVLDLAKERAATVDLELVRPPLVTGRVVDIDGKPVAAARVQVILAGRPAIDFASDPMVRTMPDGRYAIVAPPFGPADQAVLLVRAPRHSSVRSKPFLIRDIDMKIDVALPKFESITIHLIDPEKKPVANARVAFDASEETAGASDASILLIQPYAAEAVRSDANGEVVLQLAPGTYDFAADAEGYQVRTVADRAIARASTIELRLDPAFAIRGHVHRNGSPVANLQIVLLGNTNRREATTLTNAEGRFTIEGLARAPYRLRLLNYAELIDQTIDAKAPSSIEIPLGPAGVIDAHVVDADTREPVRTFTYAIEPVTNEAAAAREPGALERTLETSDGALRATLPVGVYRVIVSAVGYTSSQAMDVRVDDREPAKIDILLDRGIALTGRVIDETSAPIEGADVIAFERDNPQKRVRVAPSSARTGADGTFTVTGISAGEVNLTARKEGYVPFRQLITAEENLTPIDVRLKRGLTLEGTVTRGGKPVANAQIGASTPAIGGEHQPALTDANGRFVLRGLIAARYTVSAYKDEAHAEIRDVDPSKQKELAISLDDAPRGVIYGTVTGIAVNSGAKIVRRTVFVASEETGAEGMIDDAGNYRIEDAPLGSAFVTANVETSAGGRSSARKEVTITAGQPLRVDLDLTGSVRVSGRVLLDGKPLVGARISYSTVDGMIASATSRDGGAYEIALAGPGRYRIFAFAEQITDRQFSAVRDIRGGETIDLDLREQLLEGTVVDATSRQPLAEVFVTLMAIGAETTSIGGEVRTDANGRFRLTTAGSGAFRLIAWLPGYAHRIATVNLSGGPITPFSFELSPAGELRVKIVDARTGSPLDAHVYLTDPEGAYVPVRSDRSLDGTTFVFSVAPARYKVNAIVYGYQPKAIEVTAPGEVELRLE